MHVKKAIAVPYDRRSDVPVSALMVPAVLVPETLRLDPLLLQLRQGGMQLAVVVDEYGGTSGVVTLEDLVEEIVGEVNDEHDRSQTTGRQLRDGSWTVPGLWRPDEVRARVGVAIPDGPAYETVGGWVMATLGPGAGRGGHRAGRRLDRPGRRHGRPPGRPGAPRRASPSRAGPAAEPTPTLRATDARARRSSRERLDRRCSSPSLLLGVNAFFVGAEFAAMSARRSQLEPLAEAGSKRAAVALEAMHRTGLLLATAQLGITVCSVLLGAVSEAALHHALVPVAEQLGLSEVVADAVALVLALAIVVFLHVVFGEMIPKNISHRPARSGPRSPSCRRWSWSRPGAGARSSTRWTGCPKALVRLFGVEPKDEVASAFTAEEVAHIVDESRDEGLVERRALRAARRCTGVQRQGRRRRRRRRWPAWSPCTSAATPADIERLVAKHGFSRYPVRRRAGGDLGGYLHLKDVLYADEVERLEPVPAKRVRRMANVRRDDEVESVLQTMQLTGVAPGPRRRRRRRRSSGSSSSRTSSRSSSARSPTPPSADAGVPVGARQP